jgi:hypothetical protein
MPRPTEALIDELEPLTHAQRVRRMVDLGRRARDDANTAQLLLQLEDGDTYERWLALAACFGSRDADHVLRALADPSRLVRAWALRLVQLACDDTQAEQAFHQVRRADRKRLARCLVKHDRRASIDAFLASITQRTDPDFVALLPFASPGLVMRRIGEGMLIANRSDWRRLANSDALLAADQLERLLTVSEDADARLQWVANAVLPAVAVHECAFGVLALKSEPVDPRL